MILSGQFGNDLSLRSANVMGGTYGENLSLSGVRIFSGDFASTSASNVENFFGNNVEVFGGNFSGQMTVNGTTLIDGGTIESVTSSEASFVSISGGNLGDVNLNGRAEISGGIFTGDVCVDSPFRLFVDGGSFQAGFTGKPNSEIFMTGGQVEGELSMEASSNLHLQGTEFRLLDTKTGVLIEDLTPILKGLGVGESYEVDERDVALEGLLNDGSAIRFELNSSQTVGQDFADQDATIVIANGLPLPFPLPATEFLIFRGKELTPAQDRLLLLGQSDDEYVRFNPGFVLNSAEAPLFLIFGSVVPEEFENVNFEFSIESQAGTPGLTATVEVFNPSPGVFYETVAIFDSSFNVDVVETFSLPNIYINPKTLEVRNRIGWRQTGFTINFPWEVRIDQVFWNLEAP